MNCIHNKDEQEHCEQCNCDKPQHTPTPWKVWENEIWESDDIIIHILKPRHKNGQITKESLSEAKANAAFIVKSVNNHDALLEALKIALEALEPLENEIAETAKDAIQTALAQVEKG